MPTGPAGGLVRPWSTSPNFIAGGFGIGVEDTGRVRRPARYLDMLHEVYSREADALGFSGDPESSLWRSSRLFELLSWEL